MEIVVLLHKFCNVSFVTIDGGVEHLQLFDDRVDSAHVCANDDFVSRERYGVHDGIDAFFGFGLHGDAEKVFSQLRSASLLSIAEAGEFCEETENEVRVCFGRLEG